MKRIRRTPSPALVIACMALFVALSGVAYAAATIGSEDIINGSIRNRDFKDGTLRGQEAKRNGFGGGAIKETSLDASQLDANDIGRVKNAGAADASRITPSSPPPARCPAAAARPRRRAAATGSTRWSGART